MLLKTKRTLCLKSTLSAVYYLIIPPRGDGVLNRFNDGPLNLKALLPKPQSHPITMNIARSYLHCSDTRRTDVQLEIETRKPPVGTGACGEASLMSGPGRAAGAGADAAGTAFILRRSSASWLR